MSKKYKNIIIYGGTSEIAIELVKAYLNECDKIKVFCTNKTKFWDLYKKNDEKFDNEKLELIEVDLLELDKNFPWLIQNEIISKLDITSIP